MEALKRIFGAICLLVCCMATGCYDDNGEVDDINTKISNLANAVEALVTTKTASDGTFLLQQSKFTILRPVNIPVSPFDNKEVRAIVRYEPLSTETITPYIYMDVKVSRIDSIHTKSPVPCADNLDATYGDDPIDISNRHVNSLADGYLTLSLLTHWKSATTMHRINLVAGVNPDDPYEVELRHDANGDISLEDTEVMVAFRMDGLPVPEDPDQKLTLRWKTESGMKSTQFNLSADALTRN